MKFTKPIGSTADLREIEYISALHQTGKELRKDGTITSADIKMFLISRYGIEVDEEEVTNTIMKGFGGGGLNETDGDNMDLTELVAMLLIPTLIRTKRGMKGVNGTSTDSEASVGAAAVEESTTEDADAHLQNYRVGHGNVVDEFENNKGESARTVDFGPTSSRGQADSLIETNESFVLRSTTNPSTQPNGSNKKLFQSVLQMILADTIHDTKSPPAITVDLLRTIFLFYGEKDVAVDDALLQSMVDMAKEVGNVLDDKVFAHCLTSDVELYNTEWEDKLQSTYIDVFETHESTKKKRSRFMGQSNDDVESSAARAEEGENGKINEVMKKYTFPAIDYAVDTFRSKTYVIVLWFTWVLFYVNFMFGQQNNEIGSLNCSQYSITTAQGFFCGVGQGILTWLRVMFKLVFFGSIFIIGASVGHSTSPHNALLVLVSVVFISMYTFIPLSIEKQVLPSSDGLSAELDTTRYYDDFNYFLACGQFSVGTMLTLFCLQNILDRVLPRSFLEQHPKLQQVLASGSLYMERNMKKAANFKINRMIMNAFEIHDTAARDEGSNSSGNESMYGKALLCYSKISDATEEMGGHRWTWNGLRTGRLYEEEGIWLSNRVMQGNLGQLFLSVLLIPMTVMLTDGIENFYDWTLLTLNFPKPAKWRIFLPIFVAFLFAQVNSLGLVTTYIPSTIRTTFRFRYGALGSLHDPDFQKMRTNVDQASFIFGSMFWGCFISNVLVLAVAWCLATVACLPSFLPSLLSFLSTLIGKLSKYATCLVCSCLQQSYPYDVILGLIITILIKMLVLMAARSQFSGSTFYRSSPAVANCISVLLESWNLGISVLFVFIRMLTLVFTAFLYVARVDIPFLSDSADEIGGYLIDRWPFVFRKDMLQHEAHRHPYLERIGVMYMMKLRHGEQFGNEAGTSWRLLFVYAMFPWLRKYRIRGEDTEEVKETLSGLVKTPSRKICMLNKGESDDTEYLRKEVSRLQSEAGEARKELTRMKSEINHLSQCLKEAQTEANF